VLEVLVRRGVEAAGEAAAAHAAAALRGVAHGGDRLLGQLVGASDDVVDQLDRLVDEGLLVDEGEAFRFRHPLVQRILAETFSATRRARLLDRAQSLALRPPQRRSTDGAGPALRLNNNLRPGPPAQVRAVGGVGEPG